MKINKVIKGSMVGNETWCDFEVENIKNEDKLDDIILRLKNNSKLLATIYKIVVALDM